MSKNTASETVTVEQFNELKETFDNFIKKNTIQYEQIIHRMEAILCSKPPVKRTPKKKESGDKKTSKKTESRGEQSFYNVTAWWSSLFCENNELLKPFYTDEDIEKVIEKDLKGSSKNKIKDIENEDKKRKRIGNALWKSFANTKKDEIRTIFTTWKQQNLQNKTKNVETEEAQEESQEEVKEEDDDE